MSDLCVSCKLQIRVKHCSVIIESFVGFHLRRKLFQKTGCVAMAISQSCNFFVYFVFFFFF